ncbi:MAG: hypothetical protein AB7T17_08800 [Geobacter sp.]
MAEYFSQFLSYSFSVLIIVALAETILNALWSSIYFSNGICLYRRSLKATSQLNSIPNAESIEAALPDNAWYAPILVRQLTEDSFAFREKMIHFGMSYTPVIHGYAKFNQQAGSVEIRGYANWFPLILLSFFMFFIFIDSSSIVFLLFMLGLLSAIYLMQRKRFQQVENVLVSLAES